MGFQFRLHWLISLWRWTFRVSTTLFRIWVLNLEITNWTNSFRIINRRWCSNSLTNNFFNRLNQYLIVHANKDNQDKWTKTRNPQEDLREELNKRVGDLARRRKRVEKWRKNINLDLVIESCLLFYSIMLCCVSLLLQLNEFNFKIIKYKHQSPKSCLLSIIKNTSDNFP